MDRFLIAAIAAVFAVALPIVNVNGIKCGTERYVCAYEASCSSTTNKCECNAGYHGISLFLCGPDGEAFCQIVGDPEGKTFIEELAHPVKYSLPCQFLMSDHSMSRPYRGQDIACDMKVYGAQKRINGRMAVHGYEVVIDWALTGGDKADSSGQFSFRQTGALKGGNYTYITKSRDGDNGDWKELDFTQIYNDLEGGENTIFWTEYDSEGVYLSYFYINQCKLSIGFRPSNEDDAFESEYMPGITISHSAEDQYNYRCNNVESTFCRSARASDYNMAQAMEETGADATGLVMIDTMDSAPSQNFPYVSESCSDVSEKVTKMKVDNKAGLVHAERSCRFIFSEPNFVRCFAVGDDSNNLVGLYADCLDVFFQASPSASACEDLRNVIDQAGCLAVSLLQCPSEVRASVRAKVRPSAKINVQSDPDSPPEHWSLLP